MVRKLYRIFQNPIMNSKTVLLISKNENLKVSQRKKWIGSCGLLSHQAVMQNDFLASLRVIWNSIKGN